VGKIPTPAEDMEIIALMLASCRKLREKYAEQNCKIPLMMAEESLEEALERLSNRSLRGLSEKPEIGKKLRVYIGLEKPDPSTTS